MNRTSPPTVATSMMTRHSLPALLALPTFALFTFPRSATSQGAPCRAASGFTFAVGVGQHDRVDASASPGQFQGRGIEGALSGALGVRETCLVGSVGAGTRALSAVSG